jgi:hypothetical protein
LYRKRKTTEKIQETQEQEQQKATLKKFRKEIDDFKSMQHTKCLEIPSDRIHPIPTACTLTEAVKTAKALTKKRSLQPDEVSTLTAIFSQLQLMASIHLIVANIAENTPLPDIAGFIAKEKQTTCPLQDIGELPIGILLSNQKRLLPMVLTFFIY